MQTTVKERIKLFIDYKGLSVSKFEQTVGLSNGYIKNLKSQPREGVIGKILLKFPELNRVWLMTGEGDMIEGEKKETITGVPYYKDIPVSAGAAELATIPTNEIPEGSISINGISGKYAFPVVGCSMSPIILPGDIIVVDDLTNWDRIDPDKIYLIITKEDRMIKHLETDDTNNDILWCVSPNYKRFSIMKNEITRIYKVTFYGRLA